MRRALSFVEDAAPDGRRILIEDATTLVDRGISHQRASRPAVWVEDLKRPAELGDRLAIPNLGFTRLAARDEGLEVRVARVGPRRRVDELDQAPLRDGPGDYLAGHEAVGLGDIDREVELHVEPGAREHPEIVHGREGATERAAQRSRVRTAQGLREVDRTVGVVRDGRASSEGGETHAATAEREAGSAPHGAAELRARHAQRRKGLARRLAVLVVDDQSLRDVVTEDLDRLLVGVPLEVPDGLPDTHLVCSHHHHGRLAGLDADREEVHDDLGNACPRLLLIGALAIVT